MATINSASYVLLYTGSAWDEWWRYSGDGYSYPAVFRNPRIERYCTMPSTGTRLFTVSSSASAWRMSIDGVSRGVASPSYSAGGVQYIPGNGNGASPCACDIAEVIEFNRVLTAAEELAIGAYLTVKYELATDYPMPGDMYWDNNGSTAGFGTAAGTWAVPTTGDSSQGWSGDLTGSTLPTAFTTAVTNTLRFGSADAGLAAGTVTVSGNVTASNLTFAGSSGAITLTGGTITLADTASITVNNSAAIDSVLAGAANRLTKTGLGRLILTGANTYSGGTTINGGTLQIGPVKVKVNIPNYGFETGVASGFAYYPGGASWTWIDGAGIDHDSGTWYSSLSPAHEGACAAFIQAGGFSQNITIGADGQYRISFQAEGRGGAYGPAGVIVQIDGVNVGAWTATEVSQTEWRDFSTTNVTLTAGVHALAFLNWNTLGGDKSVAIDNIQVYQLTSYGLLPTNTAVNLSVSGVTLDLFGSTQTIGSLMGVAGTRVSNLGNLTVGGDGTDTTFAGIISGMGTVTKIGAGTLTLAGANTYTGATAVNAGGLIVVTGGSSVNGSVIVAEGATNGVQVAASGGQWACSNLTYSAGTKSTALDINFSDARPSTTLAPLRVVGDLDMGTAGISVRNGLWPTTPGIYPLVSYEGTLSGTVPTSALSLPAGMTATIDNNTGSKRIDLNVTAVTWSPSSSSTWINLVSGNASGSWGDSANWSSGFPDGVNVLADFSTLDITTEGFVNIDAPRTVGQLRFGDTAPNNNWTLSNAALTLATTVVQPVIDVSNPNVSINSVLQGTQGFVKQGSGTLWINGKSTMAGDITVSQGTLGSNYGGLRFTTGNVIVSAGATLYVRSGWGEYDGRYEMMNPIFLSGTGMNAGIGALHGLENISCNGTITLLTDSKITHDWNWFGLNGPITGADKNLEFGITVGGQYPIYVGSVNLGTGMLTIDSVQDGGSGDGCSVALNAANTYSGGTVLKNYAVLRLGNAGALGSGGVTLNPNSWVNLNTFNVSIAWLSGPGGIITDWNGAAGTTTLTVNQSVDTTYSGVITNGASRVLALVKSGSGLLTLSATNTYTGATTVSDGTLAVNGALSSSAVTVCTGAAFAAGTTGVVGRAELGGTLMFENGSALLVDVAATAADAVEVSGDVVIGTGVEVRLSGSQEKTGSWDVIKTSGTVTGDPTLINGLHGAKLSRTANAIVLTIPPMGTLIRVL